MSPRLLLGVGLSAVLISGCGDGSSGSAPSAPRTTGTITQPTVLNLYPNQSGNNAPLLEVMVTSVGTVSTSMRLGFDTGTGYMYFSTPVGASFPAAVQPGSSVSVTTPSGFVYAYTAAASGSANSVVAAGADGNSIIGIQYFTTNSFLIDFISSIEGWK